MQGASGPSVAPEGPQWAGALPCARRSLRTGLWPGRRSAAARAQQSGGPVPGPLARGSLLPHVYTGRPPAALSPGQLCCPGFEGRHVAREAKPACSWGGGQTGQGDGQTGHSQATRAGWIWAGGNLPPGVNNSWQACPGWHAPPGHFPPPKHFLRFFFGWGQIRPTCRPGCSHSCMPAACCCECGQNGMLADSGRGWPNPWAIP